MSTVKKRASPRDHMIVAKFLAGRTFQDIGNWAGVSRSRVCQILTRMGWPPNRRKKLYELDKWFKSGKNTLLRQAKYSIKMKKI